MVRHQYLSDVFVSYEPAQPLRSSGTGCLVILQVSMNTGESAISFSAPSCWNMLPGDIFLVKLAIFLFSHRFQSSGSTILAMILFYFIGFNSGVL